MTRRVGNVVIIEAESPQQCDYCAKVDELRPYGKDGAKICYACANRPENKAETLRRMSQMLRG